ncbi:hypothetical protein CsSME_00050349 [Camellia sinensis var. sinensis]
MGSKLCLYKTIFQHLLLKLFINDDCDLAHAADLTVLVQSGPSHQSNEISEEVGVESGPADEENERLELMSSSIQSSGSSEGNNSGKKSGVPSVIDHFSITDDLFCYI